jgi:SulP family sulfate permease
VHALVTVTDLVALEAASTSVAAEAGKEPSFDLDREIANIGAANLVSAIFGGMPNYMQLTPSMVSLKFTKGSGGAGLYVALLTAVSLPALSSVVAVVPRFVVGAFILDMGVGFIMETGLQTLRHTIDPVDKLLVFLVPTIMVTVEFLPGLAVGLLIALGHFVVAYSELPIVRYQQTAAQLSSNTVRPLAHREVLDKFGHHNITVIALQGYLMFGSTPQLAKALEALVARRERGKKEHAHEPGLHSSPFFVLLDARGCRGCDFGGAREILSMHSAVKRKGGELRIMGAPPKVAAAVKAASGGVVGLDHASFEEEMKRAEDLIIATHAVDPSLPDLAALATSASESQFIRSAFHKTQVGDHEAVVLALTPHEGSTTAHLMAAATLLSLGEIRSVPSGHVLWTEVDSADFFALVLSGSIAHTRGSQNHVFETAVPGSLIGFLFSMEREGGGTLRDLTARANETSRVLVVPCGLAAKIRAEHPSLDRLLNAAMLARAAAEARCAIRNQVVEDLEGRLSRWETGARGPRLPPIDPAPTKHIGRLRR